MMLNSKEYEIVNLMWAEKRPLAANEIVTLLPDKKWKDSTIHIILNGLLEKSIINVDGVIQAGRTYARLFIPAITMEDYLAEQIKHTAAYHMDKDSKITNLLAALLNDDIKYETLLEMEEMIARKKEEIHSFPARV